MTATSCPILWGRMDSKGRFSECFLLLNGQADSACLWLLFAMALEAFNRKQIFMLLCFVSGTQTFPAMLINTQGLASQGQGLPPFPDLAH